LAHTSVCSAPLTPIARKVFVTHGEDPARRALAEALDARGLRASCPDTCSKLRLR
jgi:hypothetical protein